MKPTDVECPRCKAMVGRYCGFTEGLGWYHFERKLPAKAVPILPVENPWTPYPQGRERAA